MRRTIIILLTVLLAVSCLGQLERVKVDIADRVFLAFDLDGKDYVLVYKPDNGKYNIVEGKAFPLGVIYDGSNYHCRPEGDGAVIVRYKLSKSHGCREYPPTANARRSRGRRGGRRGR